MARNVSVQILRGPDVNIPVLNDGEFYFATDIGQLYVGLGGGNLKIGAPMSIQVQGTNGNTLQPLSDGGLVVSLGTAAGKSAILKTGQITSTSVTANQVVLTYTVTAAKTLYLQYLDIQGRLTVASATASILGSVVVQISGVGVYTATFVNPTTSDCGSQSVRLIFPEPIPISAGVVISILVTPAAATSMLWTGNFGGYEK